MATRIVLRFFAPLAALFLTACGGGSPSLQPLGGGPKPIDPSGNWTITATDAGNHSVKFAALFSQTGSVVTSNSFTAAGNPAPFACTPFSANLSNGQVLNVNNFTGDVVMGNNFGTFSFNTTLVPDGKSASGTYSNMPPCTGLLTSGTFTGAEVPSTSGAWTGTLTPCTFDQQTGICTPIQGATSGSLTANLSQDDATGNVTGTYTATAAAGLSAGIVSVAASDQDILSGLFWQFTMTDNSTSKAIVNGHLDINKGFVGNVFIGQSTFQLTMSH